MSEKLNYILKVIEVKVEVKDNISCNTKSGLLQLQQNRILKVSIANAIKNVITMNLRKRLASAETLYNKLSLEK